MNPENLDENKIAQFADWIGTAKRCVVFTGAGMSTESGLPDFRSNGGLWRQNRRFEELASVEALESDYAEFLDFYRWRVEMLRSFRPHRGHEILAGWQRRGLIGPIITQNVDGFHEAAGAEQVLRLHGTLREVRCVGCHAKADSAVLLEQGGERCAACGDRRRPGVVLFGEMLDEAILASAFSESRSADLFIVLGSSLAVSPANMLPQAALSSGNAKLVIVNRDPTPLDRRASLTLATSIGPTLEAVDHRLND
jgi:NAD-dependent deacetylase